MDCNINISKLMRNRAQRIEAENWLRLYRDGTAYQATRDKWSNKIQELDSEFVVLSAKLDAAIKEAEGRARVRKITAEHICSALSEFEKDLKISKKALEGTKVSYDSNADGYSNSYKRRYGIPEGSQFEAIFCSGGWRITRIHRSTCATKQRQAVLSETAKKALIARFECH